MTIVKHRKRREIERISKGNGNLIAQTQHIAALRGVLIEFQGFAAHTPKKLNFN